MPFTLTWLGHGSWLLDTGKGTVLIDPFSHVRPADYVLISHGHADHLAGVESLLRETDAALVANFEICNWFAERGATRTEPMNLGGCIALPFGKILMTHAMHSSAMPDGAPGGNPCGFVVSLFENPAGSGGASGLKPFIRECSGRTNIYFACDTGLFGEMGWIGSLGLTVAVVPIGDRFTMGPAVSLEAIGRLRPRYVLPSHFNTWPPIAQDADAWADAVREYTDAIPVLPRPQEVWTPEQQVNG